MLKEEKLKRLVAVCRLYYEENRTQAEIARQFEISRPMVSKLLTEARDRGIVTIRITEATSFLQIAEEKLAAKFSINRAVIIPSGRDAEGTDNALVKSALFTVADKLERRGGRGTVGIGWGSLMGRMADYLESSGETQLPALTGVVCPLIGSAAASYRSYHPNELVRIFSERTALSPAYIYGPAIAETEGEKEIYMNTDSCRQVGQLWQGLDVALLNVSNYPSSPDMATASRFGTGLSQGKAVGHMLSYFYNQKGEIIEELDDRMLRISLERLRNSGSVVALCGTAVNAKSAAGALSTGLITDLLLNEELAEELLCWE